MKHYVDSHDSDIVVGRDINNEAYCKEGLAKNRANWVPFVSFPIVNACNFRCVYCGSGGEAAGAEADVTDLSLIQEIVSLALRRGVRKFRLTGGEPFLHHDIDNILSYFSDLGRYTLVNSNGSMVTKHKEVLGGLRENLRFAVSLDTLQQDTFERIAGNRCLCDVIEGIEYLKSQNLLLRLNMVVGNYNCDEVFDVIQFCREVRCDLKLLDIVSVPTPYDERESYYTDLGAIESELRARCDEIYSHEYTRGFGTPCFRYRMGETFVTVKSSAKGSHYDREEGSGICGNCDYYPCHEGLYDIFALADGRLCSCRWSEQQTSETQEGQIESLIRSFQRSQFAASNSQFGMKPRQDLIAKHNKER
jgi:molybdenum cofactor biosynthesis enzyme MoaA